MIYLAALALGLCYCMLAFSSCGEPGLLFAVVRGFLTAGASLVVEHGLSCLAAHGIFLIRDLTHIPCTGRQIFNHCTTREVQMFLYFK